MASPIKSDVILLDTGVELRDGTADPTAGGGVAAPIGSLYIRTTGPQLWQKTGAANTAWTLISGTSGAGNGIFGAGLDGNVTLGAGTTTATQDLFYDNLTIQNGATLRPNGFRVFVRNTLTIDVGGTLSASGNNGAGNSGGGSTGATGTIGSGQGGGGGGFPNGGNGASTLLYLFGLTGGAGGAGGNGTAGVAGLGGTGGTVTPAASSTGLQFTAPFLVWLIQQNGATQGLIPQASGGGGQGGAANIQGGGGGGGGGVLMISAKTIINNGTITANGGNGATTEAPAGGGGGGGGGLVIIVTKSFTGNTPTVAGGAPGIPGTGGPGIAGTAGNVVMLLC